MVSPALQGVFRSLRLYHGDGARNTRMDALYARFLKPGDLAFDIGAHVGDRVSSFRRLGARVVAVEPQPRLARVLRLIHGRDDGVDIVECGVGARAGVARLLMNSVNPTVSSFSPAFIEKAQGAPGWECQVWDDDIEVKVTTLDRLIDTYGRPEFVKVDVEGAELDVLQGVSCALGALSFEFTTIQRDVAVACVERLQELGHYRFNVALGESQRFEFEEPQGPGRVRSFLEALPHSANSGDVYARLQI